MKVGEVIQMIMREKGVRAVDMANALGKSRQTIYNTLHNDKHTKKRGMNFENVSEFVDVLGCEIVIRDIESGKEYVVKEEKQKLYKYGMRLRGFSPMCQPMEGFVERQDDPDRKYHDIIIYDRPLTKKELEDYELDNLN